MLRAVVGLLTCAYVLGMREELHVDMTAEATNSGPGGWSSVYENAVRWKQCPHVGAGGEVTWGPIIPKVLEEIKERSDFCRQYWGGPDMISLLHKVNDAYEVVPLGGKPFGSNKEEHGKHVGGCPTDTFNVMTQAVTQFKEKLKEALSLSQGTGDDEPDQRLATLSFNAFTEAIMNFVKVDVHMDWFFNNGMSVDSKTAALENPRWSVVQQCQLYKGVCDPMSPWYVVLMGTFRKDVGSCAIWYKAPVTQLLCITTPCMKTEDGMKTITDVTSLEWGVAPYDGNVGDPITNDFVTQVLTTIIDVA